MNQDEAEIFWRALDILGNATAWLIAAQKENGSWGIRKEDGDNVFGTYISVWALCEMGMAGTENVKKALHWFEKIQKNDGSWENSIDSTARGIITLLSHKDYTKELIYTSVKFLLRQQHKNGGWPREIGQDEGTEIVLLRGVSDIGATLPIITALSLVKTRYKKDKLGKEAESALTDADNWLHKSQKKEDGSWAHFGKGEGDVLATSWAIRALIDAGEKSNSSCIKKGVDFILRSQNESGGWGRQKGQKSDIIHTYNAIHSLVLSGKDFKTTIEIQKGFEWLFTRQNSDGSWGIKKNVHGLVRFTASMIIIISRALKKGKFTIPASSIFSIAFRLFGDRTLQTVKTLNKRLELYISKNMIIFVTILIVCTFFIGFKYPFLNYKITIGWQNLPKIIKETIAIGVPSSIAVGFLTRFLYDYLKKRSKKEAN